MSLFYRKKRAPEPFDPAWQPAVRRSICTGEITVGYIDPQTGKFRDLQMVPDQASLEEFFRARGVRIEDVKTIY